MGKFFPDYRTGTPEQARTHRESLKDLWRQGEHEQKVVPGQETPVSSRLNDRANETARPLSRTQQAWNFQRALSEHTREQGRLQRASDRQNREQRREQRRQERGR